jgi:hypothetical protein
MSYQLPGGRGPKKTADGLVIEQESFQQRQNQLPHQDGYFYTTGAFPFGVTIAANTANQFRLSPIPSLSSNCQVAQAQLYVSGTSAGNALIVALYTFNSRATGTFEMVPNSRMRFPTDAAGIVIHYFKPKLVLRPNVNYFLGSVTTSGIPSFSTSASSNMPIRRYILNGQTDVPTSIRYTTLTTTTPLSTPYIAFLSTEASKVL